MKLFRSFIQSTLQRRGRRYLAFYLALLLFSHVCAGLFSSPDKAARGMKTVHLKQEGGEGGSETMDLRYFDVSQKKRIVTPDVILVLHPNPGAASHGLGKFIQYLSSHARIIAPDLPGFGASMKDIPDFSYSSQAAYLSKLLEKVGVQKVHVVAIGWSGPLAMTLADREPERVASVVLISSLGVEQLQLLGSYQVNHALYGFQLGIIYLFEILVPDFGILERHFQPISYARGYFDTDLRPVRGYLKRYGGPMLILHGLQDALVPVATSKETHRLVPQSRLELYPDTGHGLVFESPEQVADRIGSFVAQVRRSEAVSRLEADPERVALSDLPEDQITYPEVSGLALALLMAIIALGGWISEELAAIGAGLLSARGIIEFWQASLAVFMGIVVANLAIFFAGKFLGSKAYQTVPFKWLIKPEAVDRAAGWFETRGPLIILLSRFIPATRVPVYFAAGVLNYGVKSFSLYFLGSCAVWTPLMVGLSLVIGQRMFDYIDTLRHYSIVILAVFATLLLLFWIVFKKRR